MSVTRRAGVAAAVAAATLLATSRPAAAHGLVNRGDLPLPIWMFAYGAGAALLISFVGLAVFWRTARLEGCVEDRVLTHPGRATKALGILGRSLGLVLFLMVFVAAAFGDVDTGENIAPVFIYVVFWVGLILLSSLVGDVWRMVNPFDTLAAIGQRLRRRRRTAHPYRLGRWPAVVGLTGFVWLELIYPYRGEPRTLAAVYTAFVLSAVARWGRGWLQQGEAFTVFFGVLARMAPLYADEEGRIWLRLRWPGWPDSNPIPPPRPS